MGFNKMKKKLNYKGKVWVEYKPLILKSWMLALFVGATWGTTLTYIKGYWNIIVYTILFFLIILIQLMYERELKERAYK